MSRYVTPCLVLNIGTEMVFVVAQRLHAQNISIERSNIVLDEIISVLISNQLITEIIKPQSAYNHETIRDIIQDITQSSSMRLDATSMSKLWDLITMVFKWQLTMCPDIIQLTLRHLYELETYTINPNTQLQLHKIQNVVENFNKILNLKEKHELREDTLYWLKDYNVRVSLLLKMGLQTIEGDFLTANLNPIAEEMLKNLGENIYDVTQNGKVLENNNGKLHKCPSEINELQLFVDQIIGNRQFIGNTPILRLSINESTQNTTQVTFNTTIDVNTDKIDDFIHEDDTGIEENTFKDDLLEMIGGEDK